MLYREPCQTSKIERFAKAVSSQLLNLRFRNSYQRCSTEKAFHKDFVQYSKKNNCVGFLFNKVAGLGLQLYLKEIQHRCFPVNIAKFLTRALHW